MIKKDIICECTKTLKSKKKIFLNRSKYRIDSAKTVILQEAFGLQKLANALDDPQFQKNFIEVLHLIDQTIAKKGKLIFIGMGKMSYVANRIAATVTSIGVPSVYVHAAETSHGDMGIICKNDIVFALSNSGESKELFNMIDYCNNFKITLIAMTRNSNGKLAKQANLVLLIPEIAEACPIGKVPTVSTSQVSALGDAIAIVMAERTGITPEKYRHFHPGGKLGASVIPISEFYNPNYKFIIIKENETVAELAKRFNTKNANFQEGIIAVVNNRGILSGYVNTIELIGKMATANVDKVIIKNIMKPTFSVELNCSMFEASNLMNRNNITNCFIVKKSKPIGVLFLSDFSKAKN